MTAQPLPWRYAARHTRLRMAGASVPLRVDGEARLPTALAHRNTLPRSAFELPADRFAAAANLIDCVADALASATGQSISVVSPVGSIVYARREQCLVWDSVHDVDIWCYVPGTTLRGKSLHRWHTTLQVEVFEELRRRGVRVELTRPNRYVNLIDQRGRRRMIELKVAHMDWLGEGLERIHRRYCGVRARRGRAYSMRPRLEWAAYSAFENHYASGDAQGTFDALIAALAPERALEGLRFVYHENLAAAWRRFGPAHIAESRMSNARFMRDKRGVLKKLLMLSVMRRDTSQQQQILNELVAPPTTHTDRRAEVRRLVAALTQLQAVDAASLASWLGPSGAQLPDHLQVGQLGEESARGEQLLWRPLFDHATP